MLNIYKHVSVREISKNTVYVSPNELIRKFINIYLTILRAKRKVSQIDKSYTGAKVSEVALTSELEY